MLLCATSFLVAMPRHSSVTRTNERLDRLVYEVQELERQTLNDRETLAGILEEVDDLHNALNRRLGTTREQPRISTAFEEAAIQLERKRAMPGVEQHHGSLRQGELFS